MTKSQEPHPQLQPEPTQPTITLAEAMMHHAIASYQARLAATDDPALFRPVEGNGRPVEGNGRPMGLRTWAHQHDGGGGGRRTSAELRQLVHDVITQVLDECATDRAGATTPSSSSGSRRRSGSSRSSNSSRRSSPTDDDGGPTTN